MRAVLVGTDLMYRQDGRLVPIEINTNTGWDDFNRVEPENEVFDLTDLAAYLKKHKISKVYLEGEVKRIESRLREAAPKVEVEVITTKNLNTVEDSKNVLIVRTAYSADAAVDSFCRDKVQFLKAIKSQEIGSEFIYREDGELKGNIETFVDNGDLPNYVIRCRYPDYDRVNYPKFIKVESIEELQQYLEENLEENFVVSPFYYSEENLWNGERIQVIRNWSLAVVSEEGDSLDSVEIGKYTKLCGVLNLEQLKTSTQNNEVKGFARTMLHTFDWFSGAKVDVLLDEGDLVWMADGSWKPIEEVEVQDKVKSLNVPVSADLRNYHTGDTNVEREKWESESSFVEVPVMDKENVLGFADKVSIKFEDGTDWYDTAESSYPVVQNEDGTVEFRYIRDLKAGDRVLLLALEEEKPVYVEKVVESVSISRELIQGYGISVGGNHLFLTRTSDDEAAYASIEHNDATVVSELASFFVMFPLSSGSNGYSASDLSYFLKSTVLGQTAGTGSKRFYNLSTEYLGNYKFWARDILGGITGDGNIEWQFWSYQDPAIDGPGTCTSGTIPSGYTAPASVSDPRETHGRNAGYPGYQNFWYSTCDDGTNVEVMDSFDIPQNSCMFTFVSGNFEWANSEAAMLLYEVPYTLANLNDYTGSRVRFIAAKTTASVNVTCQDEWNSDYYYYTGSCFPVTASISGSHNAIDLNNATSNNELTRAFNAATRLFETESVLDRIPIYINHRTTTPQPKNGVNYYYSDMYTIVGLPTGSVFCPGPEEANCTENPQYNMPCDSKNYLFNHRTDWWKDSQMLYDLIFGNNPMWCGRFTQGFDDVEVCDDVVGDEDPNCRHADELTQTDIFRCNFGYGALINDLLTKVPTDSSGVSTPIAAYDLPWEWNGNCLGGSNFIKVVFGDMWNTNAYNIKLPPVPASAVSVSWDNQREAMFTWDDAYSSSAHYNFSGTSIEAVPAFFLPQNYSTSSANWTWEISHANYGYPTISSSLSGPGYWVNRTWQDIWYIFYGASSSYAQSGPECLMTDDTMPAMFQTWPGMPERYNRFEDGSDGGDIAYAYEGVAPEDMDAWRYSILKIRMIRSVGA